MLDEGVTDLLTLQRHGSWKSSKASQGCIEESSARKIEGSNNLFKTFGGGGGAYFWEPSKEKGGCVKHHFKAHRCRPDCSHSLITV